MDTLFTRLEVASHAGDVNSLEELLEEDEHLLEKVNGRTSVGDNPLHIAAMLGHADFVRKVINCKPELAKDLNCQGLSPLHLAAAHGHVTVVEELLKDGFDLCLICEEQEGLLPLHIAVKKRRTVIVKELVEACEEAVHEITNCGETVLHLAVKYNSFDTVELLIDKVHDLNAKDDRGYTILHHAVATRKLSVVKFLLGKDTIDVNTVNSKLSTPLDVLLESPQQNGDLILGEMIRAKGGKTAAEVDTVEFLIDTVHDLNAKDNRGYTILHHAVATRKLSVVKYLLGKDTIDVNIMNLKFSTPLDVLLESPQQNGDLILGEMIRAKGGKTAAAVQPNISTQRTPLQQPYIPTLEKQEKKKEKKHDHKILLLVATLVATVTFQAALNPPGGVQPDDEAHKNTKGQPVFHDSLNSFQIFVMFALFSSVSVMMLLLCGDPRKKKVVMKFLVWVIWAAALSMGLAFTTGISVLYDFHNPYFMYVDYVSNNTTTPISNATVTDSNNNTTPTGTIALYYQHDHWYLPPIILLLGWLVLCGVVFSWVLVLLLIFFLKKIGLWVLIRQCFQPLKSGCSMKWEQLNGSNCCQFFKLVIYILLILGVLAGSCLTIYILFFFT